MWRLPLWSSEAALSRCHRGIHLVRGEEPSVNLSRTLGTSVCYILQIAGTAVLIANHIAGLYIASVGIVASFYFMISGAGLLLVGVAWINPRLNRCDHANGGIGPWATNPAL